jgi:flavin-dependent dehydrogenase
VAALRGIIGVPDAPRVRGLRFVAGDASTDADFPDGFGLVVRRDWFDRWIFERAAATPNVDARMGTPYRPDGERFLVGADGRNSIFHRRLEVQRPRHARVGLSAHVIGLEGVGDRVEVFFHREGELYVAPTGGGETLVAALFHRDRFRRDGITHLLATIPAIRDRAKQVAFTTPVLAASPLGLRVSRVVDHRLLLIGDAAGAPDPITGDGIAMAMASVKPAADAIVSGDLAAYQRVRLAMGRNADRLGRLLLAVSRAEGCAAHVLLRKKSLVTALLDVALGRRDMNTGTLVRALGLGR